jgi:hypothetical protein
MAAARAIGTVSWRPHPRGVEAPNRGVGATLSYSLFLSLLLSIKNRGS